MTLPSRYRLKPWQAVFHWQLSYERWSQETGVDVLPEIENRMILRLLVWTQ